MAGISSPDFDQPEVRHSNSNSKIGQSESPISRRDFLKAGAKIALGAAMVGGTAAAAENKLGFFSGISKVLGLGLHKEKGTGTQIPRPQPRFQSGENLDEQAKNQMEQRNAEDKVGHIQSGFEPVPIDSQNTENK